MIPGRSSRRITLRRVVSGHAQTKRDLVAVEEPLEIRLAFDNGAQAEEQSISVTMRTPGEDFELASGFLVSEGILRAPSDLREIRYCVDRVKEEQAYNVVTVELRSGTHFDPARLTRHVYTTSACGVCGKSSIEVLQPQSCPLAPGAGPIFADELMRGIESRLRQAQSGFEKTGGLHAAGLFDETGTLVSVHEDVGRHNAVDKVVGEQYLAGKLPLAKLMLMVSGRASFEIVQKAVMAGIPVVAAVGAPSSLAVDLAWQFGVTLLGFVRGDSYNVYSGAQRIMSTRQAADTE